MSDKDPIKDASRRLYRCSTYAQRLVYDPRFSSPLSSLSNARLFKRGRVLGLEKQKEAMHNFFTFQGY